MKELSGYLRGWKGYFQLAATLGVFRELDEWIRHRLRAMHLAHWKRGTTTYRALRKLGAREDTAAIVAANARRWWHNAAMYLHKVLDIAYFDGLRLARLA